jgi:leucyl aminopeptidase
MDVKLETRAVAQVESDALVMIGFEGTPPETGQTKDHVKDLYDSGEFSGKALEIAILHRPAGLKAKRLVLAGGGKRERFDAAELRKLTGAVVRALKSKGVHSITLALDETLRSDDFVASAGEGAVLADLENDLY